MRAVYWDHIRIQSREPLNNKVIWKELGVLVDVGLMTLNRYSASTTLNIIFACVSDPDVRSPFCLLQQRVLVPGFDSAARMENAHMKVKVRCLYNSQKAFKGPPRVPAGVEMAQFGIWHFLKLRMLTVFAGFIHETRFVFTTFYCRPHFLLWSWD